jgi:hypothetical protein
MGLSGSKYVDVAQVLKSKATPDYLKMPFSFGKKHISIHTHESPKLDYNMVEYLKMLRANISIMDMCRIPQ